MANAVFMAVTAVALASAPFGAQTVRTFAAGAPARSATAASGPAIIPAPPSEPCPVPQEPAISPSLSLDQQMAQAEAAVKDIQSALASCDARIERLNSRLAALQARISGLQTSLLAERRQLALLARGIYRQPDSVLVALLQSQNLGDFLTSVSDMTAAGHQGLELKSRMEAQVQDLEQARGAVADAAAQVLDTRQRIQAGVQALQATENRLSAAIAAAAAASLPPPNFANPGVAAIIQIIRDAFAPLGQGGVDWALRVAACESGYNPNAVNPYSGTEGLFQFMPSTWRGTPYAGQSPFDPHANAAAAEWLYSRDGPSQWQCK